jgi:rhamnosyltransferase
MLLAVGYSLLALSWAIANPPFAAPDEPAHYLRGLAVGGGGLERTESVRVPPGLWSNEEPACNRVEPTQSAACVDALEPTTAESDVVSGAGAYPPLSYALPGIAARATDDLRDANRAARLVTVAVSSLLFLLSALLLFAPKVGAPSLLGLVVATTPMVVFVTSIQSSSALETSAGIALAAGLLAAVRAQPVPTWVFVAIAASGALVALSRATGVIWLVLAVAVAAVVAGRSRLSALLREQPIAVAATCCTLLLAGAANRAWELAYGPDVTRAGPLAYPWTDKAAEAFSELWRLVQEWIGVFGWLDAFMPNWATSLWIAVGGGLVVVALVVGRARERLALVAALVLACCAAVLLSATLRSGELGGDVQARHLLPFLVLIPLLAGFVVTRSPLLTGRLEGAFRAVAVVTAFVHVVAWYANARRHAVGSDGSPLFFLDAEWSPLGGWALWMLVAGAGASLTVLSAGVASSENVLARGAPRHMISIVIPVKNGGADLARCLDAIGRQVVDDAVEVVVVDSGSTDGSVELARARGARVHEIPASEFGHGRTRNLGAQLATGDVLVFTSQDAFAADARWLARLVEPLGREKVGGAYGRQLPHADATPPERYFLDFLYGPRSRVQRLDGAAEPSFEQTLFSNVSSAMRRETWVELPFADDLIMSEDQEWSRRALHSGYELVYVADAVVHHSHPYSVSDAFRRFFDSGVSAERSYAAGDSGPDALRRAGARYAKGEVSWLWRTGQRRWLPYTAVYELAKFAGLQLGRRHRRLPRSLNRRLSALPSYWE